MQVSPLPDLDGRGARFTITPDDTEVNLTWCDMSDDRSRCESARQVTGESNVTNLQSYTKYNVTAEALDLNETEVKIFQTDYGSEWS